MKESLQMQEEPEIYAQAINESAKKLLVVKTLSNFFNHKDLFAVYIRTKVIHQLFEANRNLDINKLDLFHVQYTSSLIDLFQKLKKAKEQQYLLICDEIYINDDLIQKLQKETANCNFTDEVRRHSVKMADKLRQVYSILSYGNPEVLSWGDVMQFSAKFGQEFYREIADGQKFLRLTDASDKKTYHTDHLVIERKLMGKINKLNFRIKFTCGLRFENDYAEVFDFIDSNEKFVFINGIKAFFLIDEKMAEGIDFGKNLSNKAAIAQGMKIKTDLLRDRLLTIKTSMPYEVENVLAGYFEKISGVDFLEELQNVDEQTNILRAMLNININS